MAINRSFLFLLFIGLGILTGCVRPYNLDPNYEREALHPQYQILYTPSGNYFSEGGMIEDRIILTKKTSSDPRGYSEYFVQKTKEVIKLPTTYEVLSNGKWIGYNQDNLKFYNIVYQDRTFIPQEMTLQEVQNLFPSLKIIPVSLIGENKIAFSKAPFETKSFLLLNDTDKDFSGYSFSGTDENRYPFKGLVTISNFGLVKFSHDGENTGIYPAIQIQITL